MKVRPRFLPYVKDLLNYKGEEHGSSNRTEFGMNHTEFIEPSNEQNYTAFALLAFFAVIKFSSNS